MNKKILGVVILIGLIVFSFGFMKKEQEVFSSSGISFSQHRYDDKSYIDYPQLRRNYFPVSANINKINEALKEASQKFNPLSFVYKQGKKEWQGNFTIHSEMTYKTFQVVSVKYSGLGFLNHLESESQSFIPKHLGYGTTISYSKGELIGWDDWLALTMDLAIVVKEKGKLLLRYESERSEAELKIDFYLNDSKEIFEYLERLKKSEKSKYSNYYLVEDGVVFFYPVLRVQGEYVEVFIHKDDLKPFLKKNDLFDMDKIW